MNWETWRHAALVAVLAWAGVGADSLSSANYGPEEAYKALAPVRARAAGALAGADHGADRGRHLAGLCADHPRSSRTAAAATRRRPKLVHPYAGLLSGSALIVDYSLTIAISVAAATDAMFNLFPLDWVQFKPFAIAGGLGFLLFINLAACGNP